MTREEAIKALNLINLKEVHPFLHWEEMMEVRDMAISALCAQQEAEKKDLDRSTRTCPKCGAYEDEVDDVPSTNADRIRAMSHEELAEMLCTVDFCEACEYERDNGTCHYIDLCPDGRLFDGCVQAALKWLQGPGEEDENG